MSEELEEYEEYEIPIAYLDLNEPEPEGGWTSGYDEEYGDYWTNDPSHCETCGYNYDHLDISYVKDEETSEWKWVYQLSVGCYSGEYESFTTREELLNYLEKEKPYYERAFPYAYEAYLSLIEKVKVWQPSDTVQE